MPHRRLMLGVLRQSHCGQGLQRRALLDEPLGGPLVERVANRADERLVRGDRGKVAAATEDERLPRRTSACLIADFSVS